MKRPRDFITTHLAGKEYGKGILATRNYDSVTSKALEDIEEQKYLLAETVRRFKEKIYLKNKYALDLLERELKYCTDSLAKYIINRSFVSQDITVLALSEEMSVSVVECVTRIDDVFYTINYPRKLRYVRPANKKSKAEKAITR